VQALGLALLLVLCAGLIFWFFAFFVPDQRKDAIDRWRRDLSVIADTRREFLDRHILDETANASFVATFPTVRTLVLSARSSVSEAHVEEILRDFRKVFGERSISIHDAAGSVLSASDGPAPSADPVALAREAAHSGKPRIDLVRETDGFISFVAAAPVLENPQKAEAGGAVLVVGDAKEEVFDLLREPMSAATGEAVLVRREGDSALYLSPLRFRPDPPLTFRRPLNVPSFAAREALEGDFFGSFVDYRGEKVFAVGRKLKRAPWSLVVKVDEAEALAAFRKDVLRRGLTWGGLLLVLIASAFGIWRSLLASHEATLARSEARFGALVEQANDGILLLGPDNRILRANRRAEKMYGRTEAELCKLGAGALHPEELRAQASADFEKLKKHGGMLIETEHRRADGSTFPVEISATMAAGEARGSLLAVVRDVTERKAAEDRIHNLNRLLKTISEVDQLLVKVEDEESLLKEVCRVLVESGGYSLAWIGKADPETMRAVPVARAGADANLLDSIVVRWDDSPEGDGPFGTAIRTGRHVIVQDTGTDASVSPWQAFRSQLGIRSMAVLPLRRGGLVTAALVAYAAVASFVDDEEIALLDELAGDLSFALDVLDARARASKSELELRNLRQAVEQSHATVMITDLDGRIEYVNPSFAHVTGYTAEEALGQNPRFLKSGRTPLEIYRQLWETILGGRTWSGEICNKRKDGTLFWELDSISPVRDETGVIRHFVAVKEDISERKQLEAQLVQAQRMEAIGRLAGGVAHDFNNLLTVIQGYGELVRDSLSGDPRREGMDELLKAAGRATSLTRQLLAFSRKQVLEPKILHLGEVVRETGRMLERLIGEEITLALVVSEDPATVKADPGQIEQVVLNLAVNARDAMPKGGRLTVSVGSLTTPTPLDGLPDEIPAGRWVLLTVEDTGSGMDADTLSHAFEPFFTTKERGKGTGLGLSTVYGIVRQSGGYVQLSTAPGKGTTFQIYLPRSDERRVSGTHTGVFAAPGSETILVVEDEPAVRNLVRAMLEKQGYVVLIAEDGAGALEILDEHSGPIHVLLTDMVMPGMSGRDLAGAVTARRPSIRVIFMSGYTANVPADLGVEGGPLFLSKPFSERALASKLREALDASPA
jgi:two-component system cell cycle sensor histidine kinase/response regulator CckA